MSVLNWDKDATSGWRAKLVGERAEESQVEIRQQLGQWEVVIIVTLYGGYRHHRAKNETFEREATKGYHMHISANGPLQLTWNDYHEMLVCIDEAKKRLENLEIAQARRPQRL